PGDNGGGGGDSDQTCLLGLLCVTLDVNSTANNSTSERCLLNLLCLSADAQLGGNSTNNAVVVPLIEADGDLNGQGLRGDVDVAGSDVIDLDPQINLNQVTGTVLPGLLGPSQNEGNGCLLGLVCLNLGGN